MTTHTHPTQPLRLLSVHAHPDDESSKAAATTARYAAEGYEVMVATFTGGERGDILNPHLNPADYAGRLQEARELEMAEAARILGVQHRWLGFVDSGLPEGNPLPPLPEGCFALTSLTEATLPLVELIREFRPHVMITYDESGGYPHPDHIQTHKASVAAFRYAADPAFAPELGPAWQTLKMYYTHGFVRRKLELIDEEFQRRGQPSPVAEVLERWRAVAGDIMTRVTTQVRCEEYFAVRDEALRAHATQIDPDGPFFAAPLDLQKKLWPTEEFELAETFVSTHLPESDLFAGISPTSVSRPLHSSVKYAPGSETWDQWVI